MNLTHLSAAFTSSPNRLHLMEERLGLIENQAQWLCIGVPKTFAILLGLFLLHPSLSNNK